MQVLLIHYPQWEKYARYYDVNKVILTGHGGQFILKCKNVVPLNSIKQGPLQNITHRVNMLFTIKCK